MILGERYTLNILGELYNFGAYQYFTLHRPHIKLYKIPSGVVGWAGYNDLRAHRLTDNPGPGVFKIQEHPLSMGCKYEGRHVMNAGDYLPCALGISYNMKSSKEVKQNSVLILLKQKLYMYLSVILTHTFTNSIQNPNWLNSLICDKEEKMMIMMTTMLMTVNTVTAAVG